MAEDTPDAGWFQDVDPGDSTAAVEAIRHGKASRPADWPTLAVESGFAANESEYYARLHSSVMQATRAAVVDHEQADDQQLIHAVRAMDDVNQTANELAERVDEWAGSLGHETSGGVEGAESVTRVDPSTPTETRLVALATRVLDLADEEAALRRSVEQTAPSVAPNLSALAGPVLAARLIALAGGLGALARMPSGTVQVLGAEEALFAHLRGEAPSPKHGVIYTHDAVRGTRREDRGSAARALAGKLTIAARIDHYAGDRRPELEEELAERIATIQRRGEDA